MTTTKTSKKWYSIVLNVLLDIVIATLIALITIFVIIAPVKIDGASMENTIKDGQMVATLRFAPSTYKVGDIVTIKVGDKILIKRIVALAGEKIAFVDEGANGICLYKEQDSGVWVKTDESFIKEKSVYKDELFDNITIYESVSEIDGGITIEDGKFFALGDNRNVSLDSRHYGQFDLNSIVSKMIFNISENGFMNFVFTIFPSF